MNYNNFRPSLWEEFKQPIILLTIAFFILTGLNNTFYTDVSVDSKRVNIVWNKTIAVKNAAQDKSEEHFLAYSNNENQKHEITSTIQSKSNSTENSGPISHEDQLGAHNDLIVPKNDYVVIDGDISVSATEFYHPQLTAALGASDVSGQLEVHNGEVKGLSVQINGDKVQKIGINMISIGESEIQGNIFTYELEGQNYTATIYPTNPNEYMVSFVNGPWNGARVKFSSQQQNDDEYQAPEVGVTNREWASTEDQINENQNTENDAVQKSNVENVIDESGSYE